MYHMSKKFYAQYKLNSTNIIPNEIMPVRFGRELAYFMSCNAGNEDCLADTFILGERDAKDIQQIPRGLEHPVLCNYFKQKSVLNEWMGVLLRMDRLFQNVDYTLKTNYINALACTNDEGFLYELLESSLKSSYRYTQSDRRNVFYAVLENEKGLEAAIKLLNTHATSNAPVTSYGWSWQRILLNIADTIHTESEQAIFLEFLETFEHDEVTRDLLDRVSAASGNNLEDQKEQHNVKQMELIHGILDSFLEVTTTTAGSTVPSTLPTTTPSSGTSLQLTAILLGLIAVMIIRI